MHIFYSPFITANTYTLSEEESIHCIRVMRFKIGDTILLVDGKGNWHKASIENEDVKKCLVKIIESKKEVGKRKWKLHIVIAPTKNMDRLEWFIEKATEISIDTISIIECANSERSVVKVERLKKVAIAAMKQSEKAYLPEITEVKKFASFLQSIGEAEGQKFIAHCRTSFKYGDIQLPHLKNKYTTGSNAIVLIGPEGDFTSKEIEMAVAVGFIEIGLGNSRLRTETAALYACTTLNIINHE